MWVRDFRFVGSAESGNHESGWVNTKTGEFRVGDAMPVEETRPIVGYVTVSSGSDNAFDRQEPVYAGDRGTVEWLAALWDSTPGSPSEKFSAIAGEQHPLPDLAKWAGSTGRMTWDELRTNGEWVAYEQHLATSTPWAERLMFNAGRLAIVGAFAYGAAVAVGVGTGGVAVAGEGAAAGGAAAEGAALAAGEAAAAEVSLAELATSTGLSTVAEGAAVESAASAALTAGEVAAAEVSLAELAGPTGLSTVAEGAAVPIAAAAAPAVGAAAGSSTLGSVLQAGTAELVRQGRRILDRALSPSSSLPASQPGGPTQPQGAPVDGAGLGILIAAGALAAALVMR